MEKLKAEKKAKSKNKVDLNDSKSSSGSSTYSLSLSESTATSTVASNDSELEGNKKAKPLSRVQRLASSTSSGSSSSTTQILELSNRLASKKKQAEESDAKPKTSQIANTMDDEDHLRTLKREAEGLRPISSKQVGNENSQREAVPFKKPKLGPEFLESPKSKSTSRPPQKKEAALKREDVKRNHVTYSDDEEPNNTKENKNKTRVDKNENSSTNNKFGFEENSIPDIFEKKSRKEGSILQKEKRPSSVDNEELYSDEESSSSSSVESCSSRSSYSKPGNNQKNTALQNASNTTYSNNNKDSLPFDDVVVTNVTSGVVTVTIKECYTPKGFFRN